VGSNPTLSAKKKILYGLSAAAERLFVLSGLYQACFVKRYFDKQGFPAAL
jgi:hypothetical protein